MSGSPARRTVVQAIEDAAASSKTGYRFVAESTDDTAPAGSEPFFTHAGIERASARYGGALQALGAQRGDRIALILPDNADFVFAFLGAIRAGLVPVPIYPPSGIGKLAGYLDNTLHIVAKSGARLLLTNAEIKRLLGTIQAQAPELAKVVAVETLRGSREELRPAKVSLDDVAFLQFTSGSTSRPKGVVLTHANLAANVQAIMERGLGVRDSVDSGVSWLPLYHDMGLIGFVLAPIYHRNTISFLPPSSSSSARRAGSRPSPATSASISFGPNFAYALCVKRIKESEMAGLDLEGWRVAGCGAEPIRAENLRAFADKFAAVGFNEKAFVCCYGMAESTLAISFSQLGTGVTTDTVDGSVLWSKGRAEPASTVDGAAVHRPVRRGLPGPRHPGLLPRRRAERAPPPRPRGRRAPPPRPQPDERLLQRPRAHPQRLRRRLAQDRRHRLPRLRQGPHLRPLEGGHHRQRPQLLPAGPGVGSQQGRGRPPRQRHRLRDHEAQPRPRARHRLLRDRRPRRAHPRRPQGRGAPRRPAGPRPHRRRRPSPRRRRAPQDLQRQAPARQDPRAVRDRRPARPEPGARDRPGGGGERSWRRARSATSATRCWGRRRTDGRRGVHRRSDVRALCPRAIDRPVSLSRWPRSSARVATPGSFPLRSSAHPALVSRDRD